MPGVHDPRGQSPGYPLCPGSSDRNTEAPTHQERVPFKFIHCSSAAQRLEIFEGLQWNKQTALSCGGQDRRGQASGPNLGSLPASAHCRPLTTLVQAARPLPMLCTQPCPPLLLTQMPPLWEDFLSR